MLWICSWKTAVGNSTTGDHSNILPVDMGSQYCIYLCIRLEHMEAAHGFSHSSHIAVVKDNGKG